MAVGNLLEFANEGNLWKRDDGTFRKVKCSSTIKGLKYAHAASPPPLTVALEKPFSMGYVRMRHKGYSSTLDFSNLYSPRDVP